MGTVLQFILVIVQIVMVYYGAWGIYYRLFNKPINIKVRKAKNHDYI